MGVVVGGVSPASPVAHRRQAAAGGASVPPEASSPSAMGSGYAHSDSLWVAAAQVTSGEKSTPLSLCGASDFRYCFPPPAAPKCGLTFLEHPQRLSRSPSDLPSPNRRLQRTHSPLWNSISPFSSPNRRPRDPATPPPQACLQGYPPCPEHSPWGLGTHQPVSGSPLIPQGIWATQLQRDLLCPKPSHECLEPHPPRQPPSHLGPNPSGSCSGCGPLSLPLLAGLVAADAVVSLLIVVGVFVCGRPRSRPTQEDGKIYINMPGRG
uniref:Hematopoietic cell signal transducer n=1 Tax=Sus scrofa TaxID=9823 RepID=A0A8D1G3M4_PIG